MSNAFSSNRCAIMLIAMAILAGCGKPNGADDPAAGLPDESAQYAAGEAQFVIGMSQCNLGEPWRVQMDADLKAAADKHPSLKLVFKDAQNDTLRQRAHVEEFVIRGVDLLIISPKEAQPLTEPVAKAYQAGIPVIVLDRAVIGDQYTCFIGVDNKQLGRLAGQWLIEKLGGRGKVVELKGLMTSTPGQDRNSGFREALKDYPDIRILFEADMKWLEPDARKEMESALARFDDIDAVYAHNDPGAHGAYLAAKAAGREKDMLLIGIDALPHEGIAYVTQGILDVTFENPTGGSEAIDTALKILNGEEVQKNIVLGSRIFTKENVARGGEPIE